VGDRPPAGHRPQAHGGMLGHQLTNFKEAARTPRPDRCVRPDIYDDNEVGVVLEWTGCGELLGAVPALCCEV
jgi:hypothetical protein